MFLEDQLLPLSALQHLLYCPRQCALIHIERAWAENRFTAEGRVLHDRTHTPGHESRPGVRITRSLNVRSLALGISGQCDVVEFHAADGGDLKSQISNLESPILKSEILNLKYTQSVLRVLPVEYKRGKPKSHRADEVQLCAQAICLEEMLGVTIDTGCLYYGEKRRRTEVEFDATLRQLTADTAAALHDMFATGTTPLAEYEARRCDNCSLIDLCQPKALRFKRGAQAWFASHLNSEI